MKKEIVERKAKKIYILISKTHTFPSRIIKFWTKEPYAHASIALDLELREMYSFARKGIYNPFNCGFILEDINNGIFGRDIDTRCIVLELPITESQYRRVVDELAKFKANADKYRYNYWGLYGVIRNKAVEREYNYFCSQFVASVLKRSGIQVLDKEPGLVRPDDFRKCGAFKIIYKGLLRRYREYLWTHEMIEVFNNKPVPAKDMKLAM